MEMLSGTFTDVGSEVVSFLTETVEAHPLTMLALAIGVTTLILVIA